MPRITVDIDPNVHALAVELAEQQQVTLEELIAMLVRDHLFGSSDDPSAYFD